MFNVSRIRNSVQVFRSKVFILATAAIAVLVADRPAGSARADLVTSGSSDGAAIISSLKIAGVADATLTLNPNSGAAPSVYGTTQTLASANITNGVFGALGVNKLLSGSTGILTTTVSSNVTGGLNSGMATDTTSITNLNLNVLSLAGIPLISIKDAGTLTSTATVSGSYGSLSATGTAPLTGLTISVLGIDVTALVEASAGVAVDIGAALPILSSLTGLKIGVDVATATGNGITSKGMTMDSILISFGSGINTGSNIVSGDLEIGRSHAILNAAPTSVPEPASLLLTALGASFAGTWLHGSKRRAAAAVAAK